MGCTACHSHAKQCAQTVHVHVPVLQSRGRFVEPSTRTKPDDDDLAAASACRPSEPLHDTELKASNLGCLTKFLLLCQQNHHLGELGLSEAVARKKQLGEV